MNLEEIRRRQKAEPFRPFRLNLADGRTFKVPHPEFMFIPPGTTRTVIVALPEDEVGYEVIDPLMVVSLSVGENGSQREAS